jgi:hypothetical protein
MLRTAKKAGATAGMVCGASNRMVLQGGSTLIWCAILSDHDSASAQMDKIEHVSSFYIALQAGHLQ